MERFDLCGVVRCGEPWQEMKPDADGDWVRYEDHTDALAADRARIAQAIRNEMPAANDPDGLRWRFGDGSAIDGSDVMGLLNRLLLVVEGG